ncbi:MAG: fructosamine kinase family protein [Planctomycetota bacterium]|jgi:fructosamine-3-kinase
MGPHVPDAALRQALDAAGVDAAVVGAEALGGGCIHEVRVVSLADGRRLVVKGNVPSMAPAFAAEADGLRRLAATGTVLVPVPLVDGVFGGAALLVMSHVAPGPATDAAWARLGEDLARLHAAEAGPRYGYEIDNHLGATPQPNGWCDDWVRFNAEHRLGHQLDLARRHGALTAGEQTRVERVIDRLGSLVPRRPKPALLHGDLWSGNALPAAGDRVAVIDPACSIGDGWADIAMMRLFGGFPASCFAAYRRAADDHDDVETRIAVYQLYHVLNHVNLFGRGYAAQAMALAGRCGA